MTPVTLFLPWAFVPNARGVERRLAMLEFPMPDSATCESKGRALVAESGETRRFEIACEARS